MWDHNGGVGWNGVSGTDPRELADVGVMHHSVRIQKEHLTDMEVRRIVRLFNEWTFATNSSWDFCVVDGNNYVTLTSSCPASLFKDVVTRVLSHILNGA